jgi:protein-S-isoprenylcysteine O-methyltransferase Ste14
MTNGDGPDPTLGTAEKSLGEIVGEVSDKASLLVREEIELAKAEVSEKASRLGKGAGAGVAALILLVFFLTFLLHGLSYFVWDILTNNDNIWIGYFIVSAGLLLFTAGAALLAIRLFKRGAPPTPELAIEEAKRTREAIEEARR